MNSLARYHACAAGLTLSSTVERLVAVGEAGAKGCDVSGPLCEAYVTMAGRQVFHQVESFRNGDSPDEPLDIASLEKEARAGLQHVLCQVVSVQERLPRRVAI